MAQGYATGTATELVLQGPGLLLGLGGMMGSVMLVEGTVLGLPCHLGQATHLTAKAIALGRSSHLSALLAPVLAAAHGHRGFPKGCA